MSKIKSAAYNNNRTEVFFVKVVVIKPPKLLSRVIKKVFRIG